MKIVILSDYFDDRGGAVGIAKAAAFGLKSFGHDVSVITTIQNKSLAGKRNENGIAVYPIYSNYNLFWRAYISLRNPQTVGEIKRIINKLKPDVVHAHNIHTHLSYHSLKIAKQSGAKVFLTAHDVMLFHYGKLVEFINLNDLSCPEKFNYKISIWQKIKRAGKTYNPLHDIIIRHYLKYVNKIFAVSNALKQALEDNDIKNLSVIHNGININNWRIEEKVIEDFKNKYDIKNKKVILFGSRFSGIKGQDLILEIMEKVLKFVPDTVLLIAGKTNETVKKLLILAEKMDIKKNIISPGWLSGDTFKAAYRASEVVILPSPYFDSFPLINLEAMACKKPVIATCFGGSREAVTDGETGYIINPFNIEEMAAKIVDLLKNSNKVRAFGEAGYERVKEKFNLEKMTQNYLSWYNKVSR